MPRDEKTKKIKNIAQIIFGVAAAAQSALLIYGTEILPSMLWNFFLEQNKAQIVVGIALGSLALYLIGNGIHKLSLAGYKEGEWAPYFRGFFKFVVAAGLITAIVFTALSMKAGVPFHLVELVTPASVAWLATLGLMAIYFLAILVLTKDLRKHNTLAKHAKTALKALVGFAAMATVALNIKALTIQLAPALALTFIIGMAFIAVAMLLTALKNSSLISGSDMRAGITFDGQRMRIALAVVGFLCLAGALAGTAAYAHFEGITGLISASSVAVAFWSNIAILMVIAVYFTVDAARCCDPSYKVEGKRKEASDEDHCSKDDSAKKFEADGPVVQPAPYVPGAVGAGVDGNAQALAATDDARPRAASAP